MVDLKPYNSFGVAATADRLAVFSSESDLQNIFKELGDTPWYVIGGGNNILFTGDWRGTLIQPAMKNLQITSRYDDKVEVRVEAAVEWDDFVAWSVEQSLWGVENLSLIPGFVGAAPVQNIGAYGVEVGESILSVEMFCVKSGKMLTLHRDHCQFGYRNSIFKMSLKGEVIITAVNFILSTTPNPNLEYGNLSSKLKLEGSVLLEDIRRAVVEIREEKLPDPKKVGNAGSFFKNPIVEESKFSELKEKYEDMPYYIVDGGIKLAAGWLIDKAGWKGYNNGKVGVDARQALVLINTGNATGKDVLDLASKISEDIKSKFGVEMLMEVNVL